MLDLGEYGGAEVTGPEPPPAPPRRGWREQLGAARGWARRSPRRTGALPGVLLLLVVAGGAATVADRHGPDGPGTPAAALLDRLDVEGRLDPAYTDRDVPVGDDELGRCRVARLLDPSASRAVSGHLRGSHTLDVVVAVYADPATAAGTLTRVRRVTGGACNRFPLLRPDGSRHEMVFDDEDDSFLGDDSLVARYAESGGGQRGCITAFRRDRTVVAIDRSSYGADADPDEGADSDGVEALFRAADCREGAALSTALEIVLPAP